MNTIVEMVKQLRSETGAGVAECRRALEQENLNFETALVQLRDKMTRQAEKNSDRAASEGKIELYSHNNGRVGVMVEINAETEFVSRSEVFRQFGREVALQITAAAPLYVRDEDIPPAELDEQAQTAAEKARLAGKPEQIVAKIVAGVLEKYKTQAVLLRQPYIRDESLTVAQLLSRVRAQTGENIVIRRFMRWEIRPDSEE